jgi:hypothetical protein
LIVHTDIKQPAKASVKHSFVSSFQCANIDEWSRLL